MKLTADYHTHTVYSDGKNTLLENFEQARRIGLDTIGCTEHGFSHWCFGIRRREMPKYISEIRAAEQETGVKGLVGIESNIRGISGSCDLTEKDYADFDIYLAGIHVVVRYESWRDYCLGPKSWRLYRSQKRPPEKLIKYTTQAYIHAIENNPIDILTHLNFCCFSDAVEVAKCCRDYGTYLEISSKKQHLSDDELAAVAQTGVRFVINSDAHTIDRIGDVRLAEEQIARVGIPLDRIDNIDGRLPAFRFAEYKRRHI